MSLHRSPRIHRPPCRRRAIASAVPVLLALMASQSQAQQAEVTSFELGEIRVLAKRPNVGDVGADQVSSQLSASEIKLFSRDTVGDALNLLSGITTSTNSRNEKLVYLRGFDARQAPLFIDGIPVYVPYDGYVDFSRFTTSDLAAIQVTKGFSSIAYGPNALAGAINLVSRKPTRQFEGDASMGLGAAQDRHANVNLGSNQGNWYFQAGFAYSEADSFPMSDGFHSTTTEDGGLRNNAYRRDDKISLKVGLTPNSADEYTLSYYRQDGEKGQPPSTDPAYARYWQWPFWNKEGLYLVTKTALTSAEKLKVRAYHDRYDNEVDTYTNSTYTTLKTSGSGSVSTGRSIYHDRTSGASIELESTRFSAHTLRAVAQVKRDSHTERDAANTLGSRYTDAMTSFGIEDNIELSSQWTLALGAAHQKLSPQSVFNASNAYSLPNDHSATNAQAGLFYDLNAATRLYATIASKTRLPTLKDRYSQRLGTYIENPDLGPEKSVNYEVGYQGRPWQGGSLESALFFSDIQDKIQAVANVSGTKSQMQNIGHVRATGMEASIKQNLTAWALVGGTYTYTHLDNVSDPNNKMTDVPRSKITAYAHLKPAAGWAVVAQVEHDSARWASNTVRLQGFTTLNGKVIYQPTTAVDVELGVNNLTDKNYALADGFPSPGRNWFANLNYRF